MIGIVIVFLIAAGALVIDRRSPVSASPDLRMVWVGGALATIGAATSLLFWWLVVPVLVLLAGAALIVAGRHRDIAP